MRLSIIIPVYNEHRTILEIVKRARVWASYPPEIEGEIVIVDDGSSDGTRELLSNIGEEANTVIVFHDRNQGKGAAVQTGMRHAGGDILLIQDADLEYDPADYPKLLQPILRGDTQVVYGSRFLNGRQAGMSPASALGNRLLTAVATRLHRCALTDMETCYKVFTRQVAEQLNLRTPRWGFDPEITVQILGLGYIIHEVPISYYGRTVRGGKKIRWWHSLSVLGTLVRCWSSVRAEGRSRPLRSRRAESHCHVQG